MPNPGEDAHSSALSSRGHGGARRFGWKAAALVIAVFAVGIVAIHLVSQAKLRARLMRADPDAIAGDTELRRFAISIAQPAYAQHCASCHGARMEGDRRRGAPNLADRDWLYGEGRVAQIERTILHGIRSGDPRAWNLADMPAFAQPVPYPRYKISPLKPDDIRDVAEFLIVAAGKPGDQTAAKRGSAIFAGAGQCVDCHAGDAKGDAAIGAPNLIDDIWLSGDGSRDDIFNIVAHGSSGYCPAWSGQLDAATIRALAVLINFSRKTVPHVAPPSTGGSDKPAG